MVTEDGEGEGLRPSKTTTVTNPPLRGMSEPKTLGRTFSVGHFGQRNSTENKEAAIPFSVFFVFTVNNLN